MGYRSSNRSSIAWALLTAALWITLTCGRNDAPETAGAAGAASDAAPEAELPAPGTARVEYANGRVSVLSNGAERVVILEQLAEQADFELLTGVLEPRALTLRIDDAVLGEALVALLDGVVYSLDFDFDEATGLHVLTWLSVGEPVSVAEPSPVTAAPPPSVAAPPAGPAKENRDLYDEVRKRVAAMSPKEKQLMRERGAAREEAMEPELLGNLDDPDPLVRAEAVAQLPVSGEGAIGQVRFERIASLLADDPDRLVRVTAAERLSEVESPAAVDSLGLALADPDRDVVLAAIEALEDIDDPSAIPHLKPLLAHPDKEIRDAAGFAIEYIGW